MPAPIQGAPQSVQQFHAAHGIAVTIGVALIAVFAMQYLGFRFVVTAGVGR